jgi:hypothetical protein
MYIEKIDFYALWQTYYLGNNKYPIPLGYIQAKVCNM